MTFFRVWSFDEHALAGLKRRLGGPDFSQIFKGEKFENKN